MALPNPAHAALSVNRMLNYHTPHVGLPASPIIKPPALHLTRTMRAGGGPIPDSPETPFTGAIMGHGGGRTDDVPMHVPSGAYVVPAWAAAHLGQGNSVNGQTVLKLMFGEPLSQTGAKGNAPWNGAAPNMPKGAGVPGPAIPKAMAPKNFPAFPEMGAGVSGRASGGKSEGEGGATPVMVSDGEFVIHPDEVRKRGGGDLSRGHRALDTWVNKLKKEAADTIRKLPGPAK